MRKLHHILGIDLGGTATKVGLFSAETVEHSRDLHLEERIDFATRSSDGPDPFLVTKQEISALLSRHGLNPTDIELLGIAVASIVTKTGMQRFSTNIDLDLPKYRAFLEQLMPNSRTAIINDANAAALGEASVRRDVHELLLVTLGTGIGAGIVRNGRVLIGRDGTAGEIGHLCVDSTEPEPCKCGRHGCLEQYASFIGLSRMMVNAGREKPAGAKEVFDASLRGDPDAKAAVAVFTDKLAFGLAQITCVLDPDIIVLGGGLSGSADVYINEVRRLFREYAFTPCRDIPIGTATLGNSAGIYGAARYAMQKFRAQLTNRVQPARNTA